MPRDICGHCLYLDLKNCRPNGTCYCKEWRRYEDPKSGCCSDFALDYEKLRNSKYYITTYIVNVLGLGEESREYKTIQNLRDDTLETDSYYDGVLDVYDFVGPVVAVELSEDKEFGMQNCEIALESFIIPTCDAYEKGRTEEAVDIYMQMIKELMKVYGVTIESAVKAKDRYDNAIINNYAMGMVCAEYNDIPNANQYYEQLVNLRGDSRKRLRNI